MIIDLSSSGCSFPIPLSKWVAYTRALQATPLVIMTQEELREACLSAVLHDNKNLCMAVYKTKPVLHPKPTQCVFAWKIKLKPRLLQSTGEYSFVDQKQESH